MRCTLVLDSRMVCQAVPIPSEVIEKLRQEGRSEATIIISDGTHHYVGHCAVTDGLHGMREDSPSESSTPTNWAKEKS